MLFHINNLPNELLLEILSRVDGKTLGKCRRVCKSWKNAIDNDERVWKIVCLRDHEHPSKLAKQKNQDCPWYNIYKNLTCWDHVNQYRMVLREFYDFPIQELSRNIHCINSSCSVIEKNITKMANNSYALVIYFRFSIIIVRPVDEVGYLTEKSYEANSFSLWDKKVYFFKQQEVFVIDLESKDLNSNLIYISPFKLKEIQHYDGKTYLFTNCGQIVVLDNNNVRIQPISCPQVWLPQIKYINAINDKNYICYSRNLFNIETDKYRHLYLEFPFVTSLFFYGDIVIIGIRTGEIWLYRLSSQKQAVKPIFEPFCKLPDGYYAMQIDVIERKKGPVIIIITNTKVFFLEIDFFNDNTDEELPLSMKRLAMYKRMLSIKEAYQRSHTEF